MSKKLDRYSLYLPDRCPDLEACFDMGQFLPDTDQFPLEDQIKTLADDELLDFWEETQFMDRLPHEETPVSSPVANLDYERLILQELMLRSCQRGASPSR